VSARMPSVQYAFTVPETMEVHPPLDGTSFGRILVAIHLGTECRIRMTERVATKFTYTDRVRFDNRREIT
jgi:hypothetical protein